MATTNITAAQQSSPNAGGGIGGGVVGYQLSGTFSATISFEATIDGVNWIGVGAMPAAGGAASLTATAIGIWRVSSSGYQAVRARCSAWVSGTVVITDYASAGTL